MNALAGSTVLTVRFSQVSVGYINTQTHSVTEFHRHQPPHQILPYTHLHLTTHRLCTNHPVKYSQHTFTCNELPSFIPTTTLNTPIPGLHIPRARGILFSAIADSGELRRQVIRSRPFTCSGGRLVENELLIGTRTTVLWIGKPFRSIACVLVLDSD